LSYVRWWASRRDERGAVDVPCSQVADTIILVKVVGYAVEVLNKGFIPSREDLSDDS
jgi:hypothetical protein